MKKGDLLRPATYRAFHESEVCAIHHTVADHVRAWVVSRLAGNGSHGDFDDQDIARINLSAAVYIADQRRLGVQIERNLVEAPCVAGGEAVTEHVFSLSRHREHGEEIFAK